MPPEQAVLVAQRLGLDLSRCFLHREAQHLWAVANDLYGKGTPEASQWVAPLLKQIRDDQTLQVIQSLSELKPQLSEILQEKLPETNRLL